MTRRSQLVLVVSFCLLLCMPAAGMALWPESAKLYGVKRHPYPEFEVSAAWVRGFEEFFSSNLGFKRQLVQVQNTIGYALGDLRSKQVLAGRDGWLFLLGDHAWDSFRSARPLRSREARAWRDSLRRIQRAVKQRGAAFLFVVPPDKHTLYEEYMPRSATRARSVTRLDEMLVLLERNHISHLDLRTPLLAAKRDVLLYDKLGTHWSGHGARLGASLLMQGIAKELHRPPDYAELDARLTARDAPSELGSMLSLESWLREAYVELTPKLRRARRVEPPEHVTNPSRRQQLRMVFEVPDPSLPTAVFFRDSFSDAMMPALAEKFRRSVWIWRRAVDLNLVEREKPDIVVLEMTERFLVAKPPGILHGRKAEADAEEPAD